MKTSVRAPRLKTTGRNKDSRSSDVPSEYARRFPVGAEVMPRGGVHFRVWAPRSKKVALQLSENTNLSDSIANTIEMEPQENGYFSVFVRDARPGMNYKFKLKEGSFPDPASRFQPEGPHGPSQIVDGRKFKWTDEQWRGVRREGQIIYEMHIGTFTPEGTWAAAMEELPELAALGLTTLEVMPVAEFPGRFGWGYDGVNFFAPTRLYGTPDEFRSFIDRAHDLGLGIILDVVYNHVGPDGNYLKQFSDHYFTDRHQNEWGEALNFDDEDSGPVREFFLSNAEYWIDEFHLDGLRLDATHQIFDSSPEHLLAVMSRRVREAAGKRSVYLVAENEVQHPKLVRPLDESGYGLDSLWNDDFHHSARVAATGRMEAYYSGYKGAPQELISAVKWGYLYQGQWYEWQRKARGAPALGLEPSRFVTFLENHDQVANSLRGCRLHQWTSPGRLRALTALLMLSPGTPMLFQGQEFRASTPFLYFADHNPELARLVAKGRKEGLKQFPSIASGEAEAVLDNPESEKTFMRSKLDFSERQKNAATYDLHRDLIKLRKHDLVFSKSRVRGVDGAVLGPEAFVLRFFGENADDRLLLVNLGLDLHLGPAPEPLLAPIEGRRWKIMWSSESPEYGGHGTAPLKEDGCWTLPGHCALVLEPCGERQLHGYMG
jgi:maltooligosyltrehalose trehalohydrolase